MIDLEKKYFTQIKDILSKNIAGYEVRIFGSRVNGNATKYSDIDMVIIGNDKIDWKKIEELKNIFSQSNIPYIVDIIDWHSIDNNFKKIISEKYEIIQK